MKSLILTSAIGVAVSMSLANAETKTTPNLLNGEKQKTPEQRISFDVSSKDDQVSPKLRELLKDFKIDRSKNGLNNRQALSGVRGGGNVIDVDSTPYLMDLVTKAKCDWKTGQEILKSNPEIQKTIDNIAKLDWYFALGLKREIEILDYCMTGPLWYEPPYEFFSVTRRPRGERPSQVGYRLGINVYIDSNIYADMNAYNQGMLIIHETMHSFLGQDLFERKLKLRSIVSTIDRVNKGEITTTSSLHFQMQKNWVSYPRTVQKLAQIKPTLDFVNSSMEERAESIKSSLKPESLVDINQADLKYLTSFDQHLLAPENLAPLFHEALLVAMESSTPDALKSILEEKEFSVIDPLKFALEYYEYFDEVQKQVIRETRRFIYLSVAGLDNLNTNQIFYQDLLVTASVNLSQALNQGYDSKPVLELMPSDEISTELRWLPKLMIILYRDGKLSEITDNPQLYRALNLTAQKVALTQLDLRINRERAAVEKRLEILARTLKENLLKALKEMSEDESEYQNIKSQLKLENN